MIIDTTVWVHFFRKDEKASVFLLNLKDEIVVSRITVMEIVYGRKSKKDVINMWKQFRNLSVKVQDIDRHISVKAGEIFEKHFPTQGIGLLDTFIAATALENHTILATHNIKHFKFIKGLELIIPY